MYMSTINWSTLQYTASSIISLLNCLRYRVIDLQDAETSYLTTLDFFLHQSVAGVFLYKLCKKEFMGGSPGDVRWRACDVGKAKEGLEHGCARVAHCVTARWRNFSHYCRLRLYNRGVCSSAILGLYRESQWSNSRFSLLSLLLHMGVRGSILI